MTAISTKTKAAGSAVHAAIWSEDLFATGAGWAGVVGAYTLTVSPMARAQRHGGERATPGAEHEGNIFSNSTITLTGVGQTLTETGNTTLSAVVINIGNTTTADTLSVVDSGGSGVLTLANSATLVAASGTAFLLDSGGLGDGIVNAGTMTITGTIPSSPGTQTSFPTTLNIGGNSFTNSGLISVSGTKTSTKPTISAPGKLVINDKTVSNSGTILVTTTGTTAVSGAGVSIDYSSATGSPTATSITVVDTITNSGLMNVSGSGEVLNIGFGGGYAVGSYTSFTNSGQIVQTSGSITLLGEITLNGTVTSSGKSSSFVVDGILNNTGKTLNVGGSTSLTTVGTIDRLIVGAGLGDYHYASVVGGTIHDAGSGFASNYGTLDGVLYEGTLNVNSAGANLTVVDGITLTGLSGTGPGAANVGNYNTRPSAKYGYSTYVYLTASDPSNASSFTLDNATLTLTSSKSTYKPPTNGGTATGYGNGTYIYFTEDNAGDDATFTLGSGLVINEAATAHYIDIEDNSGTNAFLHKYDYGTNNDVLIDNATVSATSAAGTMAFTVNELITNGPLTVMHGELDLATYTSFDNTGTITATTGALLTIDSFVDPFSDVSTGTNTGTIIVTGSEIELGGTITAGFMSHLSVSSGGTTFIDSTANVANAGNTIATGATSNLLVLGGTIVGGTIADAGGGFIADGGTLDGVIYQGNLTPGTATVRGDSGSNAFTFASTPTLNLKDGIVLQGAGGVGAGTLTVNAGITVNTSGYTSITGGYVVDNGTIDSTGTLTIGGSVSGTGTVLDNSGTLTLGSAATGGTLAFGSASDTIVFDNAASVTDTIANPVIGDTIDLAGVAATGALISGQTLEVFLASGGMLDYTLGGNVSGEIVNTSSDGGTGTDINFAICFLGGTLIDTPHGEMPVESLARGDLVTLSDGRIAPVTWLGVQTIATRFADKLRVLPIRIKEGALGEDLPRRDLLVSPDHALLIDEVLIHAGALVNGVSIVREPSMPDSFVYYHVEVADHALVLAEGVAAETFVDNVDRMAFDNWHEHEATGEDATGIVEMAYPRAKAYRQVPLRIRQALMMQSEAA